MRGHLQRRGDDAWRVKVYVGRSGDGRKRYIERTVHGARRDAERELSRPGSDIDFLVELAPGTRPLEILALGADLEEALGVKVDVGTRESLRSELRAGVLAAALRLRAVMMLVVR